MKNLNILVSGASVAGLGLAYWLRRHGFRPTVLERAAAPREGGQAIDVRGAAIDVVERMGLLGDIRRESTEMRGMSLVDRAGKPLFSTTELTFTGGLTGSGDVEIIRGDLVRILHGATRHPVQYVFGDSIVALDQRQDGVHVSFERGSPRTFDLVVGADGLHSNVRALAFGDESRHLQHLGVHLSVFSVPNHLGLDRWQVFHPSPRKIIGIYSARKDGKARAMLGFSGPHLDFDPRDAAHQKKLLAEHFAGEGWEVPRLLREMESAPDFYFDSMSQVCMDAWSAGRVALVGDAACCPSPMSGQGTSVALVGAYVLAGELAAAGGDHRAAFTRYQEKMWAYAAQNQKLALEGLRWAPKNRWDVWARVQAMRALAHLPWRQRILDGAMRPLQRAARGIVLERYEEGVAAAANDSTWADDRRVASS